MLYHYVIKAAEASIQNISCLNRLLLAMVRMDPELARQILELLLDLISLS